MPIALLRHLSLVRCCAFHYWRRSTATVIVQHDAILLWLCLHPWASLLQCFRLASLSSPTCLIPYCVTSFAWCPFIPSISSEASLCSFWSPDKFLHLARRIAVDTLELLRLPFGGFHGPFYLASAPAAHRAVAARGRAVIQLCGAALARRVQRILLVLLVTIVVLELLLQTAPTRLRVALAPSALRQRKRGPGLFALESGGEPPIAEHPQGRKPTTSSQNGLRPNGYGP